MRNAYAKCVRLGVPVWGALHRVYHASLGCISYASLGCMTKGLPCQSGVHDIGLLCQSEVHDIEFTMPVWGALHRVFHASLGALHSNSLPSNQLTIASERV